MANWAHYIGTDDWYRRGAPKDEQLAAEWCRLAVNDLREAANRDDSLAQRNLGMMYMNGHSVPKDDAQAAEWFRKAAEQGFAAAQSNLGFMYTFGRGVPKDWQQALTWCRKAAAQGDKQAQEALRWMGQ